jgi:hypothetical protein
MWTENHRIYNSGKAVDERRFENKGGGKKSVNPAVAFWLAGSQKFALIKRCKRKPCRADCAY